MGLNFLRFYNQWGLTPGTLKPVCLALGEPEGNRARTPLEGGSGTENPTEMHAQAAVWKGPRADRKETCGLTPEVCWRGGNLQETSPRTKELAEN